MNLKEPYFTFLSREISEFESFLKNYFASRFKSKKEKGLDQLRQSIEYTLFAPCKRFRPALSIGVCQALGLDYKICFPLASSIELIHTASLIHDDLPEMDNDNQRRNQPSNHLVYGEDMALLSGDALFVESFYLLCHFKQKSELIQKVAEAASLSGIMGGQALDLNLKEAELCSQEHIQKVHFMKTGILIQVCVEGVCCLVDVEKEKAEALQKFSYYLGQAFQLADDLEDKNCNDKVNILKTISEKQALDQLDQWTKESLQALDVFQGKEKILKNLILFNQSRVKQ